MHRIARVGRFQSLAKVDYIDFEGFFGGTVAAGSSTATLLRLDWCGSRDTPARAALRPGLAPQAFASSLRGLSVNHGFFLPTLYLGALWHRALRSCSPRSAG